MVCSNLIARFKPFANQDRGHARLIVQSPHVDAATIVVDDVQRYVESVVNNGIQAVYGELTALRGEVRGELAAMRGEMKGMSAAIDALKHQVTLMGILIIVGLAIAAGPIVAKFIR